MKILVLIKLMLISICTHKLKTLLTKDNICGKHYLVDKNSSAVSTNQVPKLFNYYYKHNLADEEYQRGD